MSSPFIFGLLCCAGRQKHAVGLVQHCLLPEAHPSAIHPMCSLQTHGAWRELHVEKRAHELLAARGERGVQAYSIALQQADAELEQHRLQTGQQLGGKHAALQHGIVRPACPARASLASPHHIPSIQPGQAVTTAWSVARVCSMSCSVLQ